MDDRTDVKQLSGKAATQERILLAATELFLSQGYERTTVAEVAQRAGVSRATVFWHFSDKAGLFREAFNRLVEPFRVSIESESDEPDPEKRLTEQVALYRSFTRERREALYGFIRWAMEAEDFRETLITTLLDMHQRFAGALTETIAELTPGQVDPRSVSMAFLILLDGDLLLSFFDESERRAEERHLAVETLLSLIPRARESGSE
jgi:AcrR family transcriptional regulator